MSDTTTPLRMRYAVAEEVRVALARRQISGVKLANMIGRSQVYVSRRLRGEVPFDVDDLALIAEALGMKMVDLVSGQRYLDITHAPAQVTHKTVLQRASRRPPTRPADLRPIGRSGGSSRPNARVRTSRVA